MKIQVDAYELRISDWSSDVCSSDLYSPARNRDIAVRTGLYACQKWSVLHIVYKGRERPIASRAKGRPLHSSGVNRRAPATPHINDQEQGQPDNVDKGPVPGSSIKTEVLTRCKVSLMRAEPIDDQENGAGQYVEAVKACRHVKG